MRRIHLFRLIAIIGNFARGTVVHFIHHGPSNSTNAIANPFFGVVNKGAVDAGEALGATVLVRALGPGGGTGSDWSVLVDAAVADNASAIVTSVTSNMKPCIVAAVEAGIPVYAINMGIEHMAKYPVMRGRVQYMTSSATCGDIKTSFQASSCCNPHSDANPFALTGPAAFTEPPADIPVKAYIGQDDYLAGRVAGQRAASDGVTQALCILHEPFADNLVARCSGYSDLVKSTTVVDVLAFPATFSVLGAWPGDPLNDPLLNKTVELLVSHPGVAIQTLSPVHCLYFATAIAAHTFGLWNYAPSAAATYLSCFDTFADPNWFNNVKTGIVKFTIDQGAYLQGYHSVSAAILQARHGIAHYGNILTGPKVVDSTNVAAVEVAALAGYA